MKLSKNNFATLISAYAPTMTNSDEEKDKFYEELDAAISGTPKTDKLIILGDFNARVGKDFQAWQGVLGPHVIGKCNSNGSLLLNLCSAHELTITNTIFRLPTRKKTSWMHPRSKQLHLIDYIIIRKRDIKDVRVTKAMCGAECWTDHRLIVSKLNFTIARKRRPQGQKIEKRLNIHLLSNHDIKNSLSKDLDIALGDLDLVNATSEDSWASFKGIIYAKAKEHLGVKVHRHQDWFDENNFEITSLLEGKHNAFKKLQGAASSPSKKVAYRNIRNTCQKKLREIKDKWLIRKAEEIQMFADRKDHKRFYEALRTIYGPHS